MERIEERLRRLSVALDRVDSAWRREHSLTANEQLVISLVTAEGALTPSRLSAHVGLTTAGMSTLLDRLEASGLVARQPHPSDGRRVLVTPTKQALRARMSFDAVHMEIARSVAPEDVAAVEAFLARAADIALGQIERPHTGS